MQVPQNPCKKFIQTLTESDDDTNEFVFLNKYYYEQ